jgi:hypothetical protein
VSSERVRFALALMSCLALTVHARADSDENEEKIEEQEDLSEAFEDAREEHAEAREDAREDRTDELEEQQERAEEARLPKRRGIFLRGVIDYSWARLPFEYVGTVTVENPSGRLSQLGTSSGHAVGTRFEAGYAFARGQERAWAPRAAFSLARVFPIEHRQTLLGVDTSWSTAPIWWSLAAGVEIQIARRILGLSLEGGTAGLFDQTSQVEPAGVSLRGSYLGGVFSRAGANVRFPPSTPVATGVMVAAEGFVWIDQDLGARSDRGGWRLTCGIFLEWDRTREVRHSSVTERSTSSVP